MTRLERLRHAMELATDDHPTIIDTDDIRAALAVCEAAADIEAKCSHAKWCRPRPMPCQHTATCIAVRALLAEAPEERPASPDPAESYWCPRCGGRVDTAPPSVRLDGRTHCQACRLGATMQPGGVVVWDRAPDERPANPPATATRNLLAGSEMVVQFRAPLPPDAGEGWERCDLEHAEQTRCRRQADADWSPWCDGKCSADGASYEYRRRASTCATCRDVGTDRRAGPCCGCRDHSAWSPAATPTQPPPGPPVYIEVAAGVRYWEDARVNGVEDADGKLIPFRQGDLWCPVIRLADGQVMDWPAGYEADIHYKVCDAGEYWLLDASRRRVLTTGPGEYVPDAFLCHGDRGYGDYIIMSIGPDGKVRSWTAPVVDPEAWRPAGGEGGAV